MVPDTFSVSVAGPVVVRGRGRPTRPSGLSSKAGTAAGRSYTDWSERSLRAVERRVRETHRGRAGGAFHAPTGHSTLPYVIAYLAITGYRVTGFTTGFTRSCYTPPSNQKPPTPSFGALGTVCAAATLAVLPLGGDRHRPLLQTNHGGHGLQDPPDCEAVYGFLGHPSPKPERPKDIVCDRGKQFHSMPSENGANGKVSAPALRGHRETWLDCRARTRHPDRKCLLARLLLVPFDARRSAQAEVRGRDW